MNKVGGITIELTYLIILNLILSQWIELKLEWKSTLDIMNLETLVWCDKI